MKLSPGRELEEAMSVDIGFNRSAKIAFRKAAMRVLRAIRKNLGLSASECSIKFNPGGIAVSGEAILHGDKIYIQIYQSCLLDTPPMFFRKCNGRGDYVGNRNICVSMQDLTDRFDKVCEVIARVMNS